MQVRKQQQGFTLIELAVSFALMTVAIVGSLSMFEYSRRVDQGRAVGKHMLALSAALIEYKTQNKDRLMSLPLACGQPTFRVGGALPEPSVGVYPRGHSLEGRSLCAMAVPREGQSDFVVDNGMQPTYQELIAVGVLAAGSNGNLVLPTDSNRIVRANNLARTNVYAFLLQRECKARTCNPQTGPFNLQSWVFNLQPYRIDQRLFGSGARIGAAVAAMDGQGYLSPVGGDGRLRNLFNNYIATNPVVEANGTGAIGILAAYDGWGLGNERFAYRDGTRPPTADWNFDNYSLVGVNDFNSKSATIGTATVNTATMNTATINTATIGTDTSAPVSDRLANRNAITNNRALLAKGNIVTTVGSGIYTNNLNAAQDVVAGGNLGGNTVSSTSTINAGTDITAARNVNVGGLLSVNGNAHQNSLIRIKSLRISPSSKRVAANVTRIVCDGYSWKPFVVKKMPKFFTIFHSTYSFYDVKYTIDFSILVRPYLRDYEAVSPILPRNGITSWSYIVPASANPIRVKAWDTKGNLLWMDTVTDESYSLNGGCYTDGYEYRTSYFRYCQPTD